MSSLIFRLNEVLPLIEHTESAPRKRVTLEHLITQSCWKEGVKPKNGIAKASQVDQSKLEPALLLVHDEGVYLMSGGDPALLDEKGSQRVVYAVTCNPKVDPGFHENARKLCGGDDFVESIPIALFREAMKDSDNPSIISIMLTRKSLHLSVA